MTGSLKRMNVLRDGLRVMPESSSALILIANRGEIACRIIETAKRLGIASAAVYTEADSQARHVKMADVAVKLRAPPQDVSGGYLDEDAVIGAAKSVGAAAVHPGYGFLSERASFADKLFANNISFIGPPATAISALGDKANSKRLMTAAEVPVVPGYHGDEQSDEALRVESEDIGFPLMIKAVLGGGGKGMRAVYERASFDEALKSAQRESIGAFGDSRVLLEKLVEMPRHIEVQVFCDMHGNAVHLFERDCSVQRRHQKVLEEAPAPGIDEDFRMKIGRSAVDAAKAVGYVGAGTVEFIMDGKSGDYYFMEMNTRLQVEHPVTELITGTDLVQWQIQVAQGGVLPKTQEDLTLEGSAIEARLYAENPDRGFLPSTGMLQRWQMPKQAQREVRVDTGFGTGDQVSPYYDAMLAKLIVWGPTRNISLQRMRMALQEIKIAGVSTNVDYLRRILDTDDFSKGGVTTAFIEENSILLQKRDSMTDLAAAASVCHPMGLSALALHLYKNAQIRQLDGNSSAWTATPLTFRLTNTLDSTYNISGSDPSCTDEENVPVTITSSSSSSGVSIRVAEDSQVYKFQAELIKDSEMEDGLCLKVIADSGATYVLPFVVFDSARGMNIHMWDASHEHIYILNTHQANINQSSIGTGTVKSPMPGKIVKVSVEEGDTVEEGSILVVLEAMKMEHALKSTISGTVKSVSAKPGEQVADGAILAVIEASTEAK